MGTTMVYGLRRIPRGPLAVLKENWTGFRDMPLSLGQTTVEYLNDLRQKLEIAGSYATEHSNGIFHAITYVLVKSHLMLVSRY